jgi:hypothetical protein
VQQILVIQTLEHLPITSKVFYALTLGIPLVPYSWVNHCLQLSNNDMLQDAGWCFSQYQAEIKDTSKLLAGISI